MTLARRLTYVAAGLAWLAVLRLGWAFFTSDLTFEYVASQSRRSAPWWYRVAGMWGGMAGSLLLFAAIAALVIAVAAWSDHAVNPGAALVGAFGLPAMSLAVAWPFQRLDVPEVEGFGLTPILEHPAMAIHPPLLYIALACTMPPLLGGRSARRWLLLALGLLTLAMTLGGLWSYVEQGWGGYWAWDPVENASLAPWLATIIALHATAQEGRTRIALVSLPGLIALAGAASSRSGAVPSVHSFAEAGDVGWGLGAFAVAAVCFVGFRLGSRGEPDPLPAEDSQSSSRTPSIKIGRRLDSWQLTSALLVGAALALVVLLTAVPLIGSIGDRNGRIDGRWFALLLAPVALVVAGALILLAVRRRSRVPAAGWMAHAGILVLLAGVAGSSFERSSDGSVMVGDSANFAGVIVTNTGIDLADGPSRGTTRITANLIADGHSVAPSIVAYPERGGVLAETALVTRPWRDVQIVLNRADDQGRALIEVRTKPLVQLIWFGAAMVTCGTLLSRRPRRRRPALPASSPAIR